MMLRTSLALTFGILALSANAAPANGAAIDASVKSITDAASRTLTKSAAFCASSHLPAGQSLDERLKTYLANMATGSRAAMVEIAAKDSSFVSSSSVYSPKDLEMLDKQADTMLQNVKAQPAAACTKMGTIFDAGTPAFFKDVTQQGYQQYVAARAAYCARSPKPANCK